MFYSIEAFISITVFGLVHFFAGKAWSLDRTIQGRLLSIGGGVSISYVFVDLLPKLCQNDVIVKKAFAGVFPYVERHVFIMALAGFLLFFIVDRSNSHLNEAKDYRLSFISYAFFNFLVGYAVADKDNPEVHPLGLFTFAMALHYFINDFSLSKSHGKVYDKPEKRLLILSLFLGWVTGYAIVLPEASVALISAFIGGGVIMNVIRHELPKDNPHSLSAFLLASALYTVLLLSVG